jgi:hypothetical protein
MNDLFGRQTSQTNYWIFTVTSHKSDGRIFMPQEILEQRFADQFWGFGEKTPSRRSLEKGDEIVFYVGNPVKAFSASARLASNSFQLTEAERGTVSHGTNFYNAPYGVRLEHTNRWSSVRPVDELLANLDFIENKEFWMAYFQGGVRQITEKDYRTICSGVRENSHVRTSTPADIERESKFALETHLEEFLDRNWDKVDFGARLEKYEIDEQSGRQFPAGPWSIDFLCIDKDTGDLVVLELKRGKTSDSTVGQVLRYIAYVQKHLAKPNQAVRGIIIAKEADEALRYAIQPLPLVKLLTYRVNFKLSALTSS